MRDQIERLNLNVKALEETIASLQLKAKSLEDQILVKDRAISDKEKLIQELRAEKKEHVK